MNPDTLPPLHRKVTISMLVLMMLMICGLVTWISVVIPHYEKMPANYSYKADIYSIDNLYDEVNHRFSGPSISNTKFSYKVKGIKNGIYEIENVFDVRKQTGEKIFAVTREYGIDPNTRKHVSGYGDQNREGYLFGPRNANRQSFTYWHINYNTPITMKFDGEDTILGLQLEKYVADFHNDQTKELANLPGVGITRGVDMDVHLVLWIEPQTGQMVKYADSTNAYFYDLKTNVRLNPWNRFSNTFTFPSVANHVALIQREIFFSYALKNVVPGVLFTAIILLFLSLLYRTQKLPFSMEFLPYIILIIGLLSSYVSYRGAEYYNFVQAERKFGTDSEAIITVLTDRLSIYANGMRGAKGLFEASASVERNEFRAYVDALDFAKNFPGIQAFGYSEFVQAGDLPSHIKTMQQKGFPQYTVVPVPGATKYAPVIFIEPFVGRNAAAIGYNSYGEIGRQTTIEEAVSKGDIELTGKLLITADNSTQTIPAFSMYLPIYKKNMPLNTVGERKAAAQGVVLNAYRAPNLFGTVLRDQILDFGVNIYDGSTISESSKLFDSAEYFEVAKPVNPDFRVVQTKSIFGRDWTFEFNSFPGYSIGGISQYIPYTILVGGIFMSLLLTSYLRFLISSQQDAFKLVEQTTGDIRKLQKAIENSSSHTIITDVDGKILFANKAAQTITGYSMEEMRGKTPSLWKSGKMPPEVYVNLWKTIKTDKLPFKGEFINKRKNGEFYNVVATISPILEGNELTGFIGTEEDISGRVASEADLKKQKSDLERVNKVMVERELKMIELKKEIEVLKKSQTVS